MTETTQLDLKQFIREIPNFPKPGILFRDITPLLASPEAFREAIRVAAMLTMEQLGVLRAVMPHLHELPAPLQDQVMQLWHQATARTNSLPLLPGSYPPQGG